jgi:hypothetical protein
LPSFTPSVTHSGRGDPDDPRVRLPISPALQSARLSPGGVT